MVNEPMGPNICFWYIPPAFRKGLNIYTDEYKTKVHKLIFDRMVQKGTILISHQPLAEHNLSNFWRICLKGEKSRIEDMDYIL